MVAHRLKALRALLNLSQAAFGRRLGVSRDVINNLECGRVAPKEVFIDHLCEVYRVRKAWLICGEEPVMASPSEPKRDLDEAAEIFAQLSPKLKALALSQIRGLLALQVSDDHPDQSLRQSLP